MAQQWRYPATPIPSGAGTPVTGAALTSGLGGLPLPQLPPVDRPAGRLIIEAQIEASWPSTGGTVVLAVYLGAVGQAIGSKTLIAATASLSVASGAAAWPIMVRYSGRFRTLSPSAGVIYGQGEVLLGSSLTAWATSPFPGTQALRTVSTLNTDQVNEIDFGITPSSATGTPSFTLADFAAEYSG